MLETATNLLKRLLVPANMAEKNEIVDEETFGQKLKIFKKLAKIKKSAKLSKSQNADTNIKNTELLITNTKIAFIKLKQAFIKALIFQHFHWEYYIWIKTNALGYAIGVVLSKLILDLG